MTQLPRKLPAHVQRQIDALQDTDTKDKVLYLKAGTYRIKLLVPLERDPANDIYFEPVTTYFNGQSSQAAILTVIIVDSTVPGVADSNKVVFLRLPINTVRSIFKDWVGKGWALFDEDKAGPLLEVTRTSSEPIRYTLAADFDQGSWWEMPKNVEWPSVTLKQVADDYSAWQLESSKPK